MKPLGPQLKIFLIFILLIDHTVTLGTSKGKLWQAIKVSQLLKTNDPLLFMEISRKETSVTHFYSALPKILYKSPGVSHLKFSCLVAHHTTPVGYIPPSVSLL
eukprot:TRINITY_DN25196_c0_g1_i1.p1 TRINITY_DN25196_c0_g1~~TRINITY_DN25196_c0_g1_i1.p1  ORF type:complete len:103 (-),score=12.32 TRINITY_DN25196_c0_g1_i1:186-494(-)